MLRYAREYADDFLTSVISKLKYLFFLSLFYHVII